ncbi:type VI secretion protein EvpB [Klebsiella pneumoniae]|nr:type VI secretion protein EvpB [Klebsiella pneumoniae]
MSVTTENAPVQGQTTLQENRAGEGVYASLFEKINLAPASRLGDINDFLDDAALSETPAAERLTAAMQVFMERIRQSGQRVEKLDKTLIDHHIAELDFQISRQLDAVMHHQEFQQVESLWRGLKQLVDNTDYRQNVKTEILDVAKDDLRQDFEDAPELIQSGLYWHTYTAEYDTPGGEPIGSGISAYEFDASPQDVALLRNISRVSAAAHMPFIGAVGPAFFLKETMEEVAAIKDIGNYFDRAEYIRWKAFRETDDARYIGLVMPRVLGRLPYGPDTVPVRSFNYVEQVKGPDHEKYLWTSAAFSFASNMVKSFVNNGWCVQIRGPQAGGAVKDLPIHLYDLGTGNQVKIPSEVMIPETREFEFASLGFIPLSYYKNRDYACFFSANSAQKPALYDTADATANSRRLTAAMQVFMERIRQSGQRVEKLDKTLIDHHIAELDFQISRQLDAVMHHQEFQQVESLWRGLKQLVDNTDYRQNVKTEILDVAKDDLRQDFEDASELIQSGLYWHTYTAEYDTPGGEPIGSVISAYEFDASPQDVALLRNISRVSAAAHMPFIGAVGPAFFLKETMEEVAAIKDIGNYFDRAEYIRWKAFRETDDARYIGLVMPRVLGRLPYGPDTVPVRSFNYVEQVKGPDHEKYLWTSAAFSFASNMVKSFVNNGWCVQIRGPQAGGAVKDLPIHLYDLGTGNQVKIPSEVMIPETREFEFASLGFIPLSYYKNRDYACFFSANSAQKPALYDTADATANSRINARLPYIFLLSRIAHYLKMIQRENIGTTKDRRLLELELNTWVRSLVTEMTDPGDELQASHPLRDASVVVEDIEDNPGFFRVKLYAVPHFQVEGMDVNLSLVSQMPKAKA